MGCGRENSLYTGGKPSFFFGLVTLQTRVTFTATWNWSVGAANPNSGACNVACFGFQFQADSYQVLLVAPGTIAGLSGPVIPLAVWPGGAIAGASGSVTLTIECDIIKRVDGAYQGDVQILAVAQAGYTFTWASSSTLTGTHTIYGDVMPAGTGTVGPGTHSTAIDLIGQAGVGGVVSASISGFALNGKAWTPKPYSGGFAESGYLVSWGTGSLSGQRAGGNSFSFAIQAGVSDQIRIHGVILKGGLPMTEDVPVILPGRNAVVDPTFNPPFGGITYSPTFATAPLGVLDVTIDQTHFDQQIGSVNRYYQLIPRPPDPAPWGGLSLGAYRTASSISLDCQSHPAGTGQIDTWTSKRAIVTQSDGTPTSELKIDLKDDTCWAVTTFAHAVQTTVESFGDTGAWTATNCTIAAPFDVTGTSTDAHIAHADWCQDLRNYRYLELTVNSDNAGVVLAVQFDGKTFTVPTLTAGLATYEIDLCHPDTVVSPDPTRTGYDIQPGSIYGVQRVGTLTIHGFPNGSAVRMISMVVKRKGSTVPGRVWREATPSMYPYVGFGDISHCMEVLPVDQGVSTTPGFEQAAGARYQVARQLQGIVDGKIGPDLLRGWIAGNIITEAPFGPGYIPQDDLIPPHYDFSAEEFVFHVNAQPGLSATAPAAGNGQEATWTPNPNLPAVPATYALYAGYFPASGLTLDSPGSPAPLDTDLANKAINAWAGFTTVQKFTGCSSDWYTDDFEFIHRIGGTIQGLVITPHPPAQGVNVSLNLNDAAYFTGLHRVSEPAQTVATDANGYFRFAPVWNGIFTVTAAPDTADWVYSRTAAIRWIGLFGQPPRPGNVSNRHSHTGAYQRVGILAGNVYFSRSESATPHPWSVDGVQVTSADTDADPKIWIDGYDRVWVAFSRSHIVMGSPVYDVYAIYSDDFGTTWNAEAVILPDTKHPTVAMGVSGGVLVVGYSGPDGGPGALQGTFQAPGDTSFGTPFALIDNTGAELAVKDDTFGISQGREEAQRWILAVVINGDSGVSEWGSADEDGQSWTLIA